MKTGKDAVIAADFPLEFAAGAAQKSFALKSCLSIRAGQPPNMGKPFGVSPKPISIKTKTTSSSQGLPLLAGFIPIDQATFGRPHSKDLPANCESAQLKMTLKELMNDVAAGKYELTALQDGKLEFKSKLPNKENYDDPHIDNNDITFRIDLLAAGNSPLLLDDREKLRPWHQSANVNQPDFWSDALGKFDPESICDVEYKLPNQDFAPLELAAIDGKPVTGDADMLSIAVPLDMERKGHGTMYNASEPSQRAALLVDFVMLMEDLNETKYTIDQIEAIKANVNDFVKNTGIITSYQLLTALSVNDAFANESPIFSLLFQHGPETNNPGPPSNLDGDMLHFYKGLPVLTQSENELVSFVMQPGFLEDHFYPVHPGWDMTKWAHVIERQLDLGQMDLINPKTLEAYNQHAMFMARMDKDAPEIDRKLMNGEIAQISPQQLEDFDKYMKIKDADRALNHTMQDMAKQLKDCGLADTQYMKNKNEFEITPPAPVGQQAVVNNNNNNNNIDDNRQPVMGRRM